MQRQSWGHCTETFALVPGTAGRYEVSNLGRVRSVRRDAILRQVVNRQGFLVISLPGPVPAPVHRLVAEMFVDKPASSAYVHHLNGCKFDNRAVNLVWSASKARPSPTAIQTPPEPWRNLTPEDALLLCNHPSLSATDPPSQVEAIRNLSELFEVPPHVIRDLHRGYLWAGVTCFDRVLV
jgi:hypothetical protein